MSLLAVALPHPASAKPTCTRAVVPEDNSEVDQYTETVPGPCGDVLGTRGEGEAGPITPAGDPARPITSAGDPQRAAPSAGDPQRATPSAGAVRATPSPDGTVPSGSIALTVFSAAELIALAAATVALVTLAAVGGRGGWPGTRSSSSARSVRLPGSEEEQ